MLLEPLAQRARGRLLDDQPLDPGGRRGQLGAEELAQDPLTRLTAEVRVGNAVTVKMLPCPRIPVRRGSSTLTLTSSALPGKGSS